eukprot:TRINITY_DN12556_c0_g2_i1.p4 TRINITY_DN12556_c0_g2~~TRINITY_DN12556_c0_g2_i1.p4  ORF type:complete len:148 (+),score=15.50 TRINITY_DN12556_c0_g2_i1:357-800(+)
MQWNLRSDARRRLKLPASCSCGRALRKTGMLMIGLDNGGLVAIQIDIFAIVAYRPNVLAHVTCLAPSEKNDWLIVVGHGTETDNSVVVAIKVRAMIHHDMNAVTMSEPLMGADALISHAFVMRGSEQLFTVTKDGTLACYQLELAEV